MRNRQRAMYAVACGALLLIEVLIALFVHDGFIRPYVGDVLVTVLLCCAARVAFPDRAPALPVFVFLFAAVVEVGQHFDFVARLGLADNRFLSTLLGRTFSVGDILCYAVGCALFAVAERVLRKKEDSL